MDMARGLASAFNPVELTVQLRGAIYMQPCFDVQASNVDRSLLGVPARFTRSKSPRFSAVQQRDRVAVSDADEAALDGLSSRLESAITPARKRAANAPIMSHINFSSTNMFSI